MTHVGDHILGEILFLYRYVYLALITCCINKFQVFGNTIELDEKYPEWQKREI